MGLERSHSHASPSQRPPRLDGHCNSLLRYLTAQREGLTSTCSAGAAKVGPAVEKVTPSTLNREGSSTLNSCEAEQLIAVRNHEQDYLSRSC